MVNTTTAADQVLRSVGAVLDGGYSVAWISGNTALHIQRYDSSGSKIGGETAVRLAVHPLDDAAFVATNSSMAVLADGGVVVVYRAQRTTYEPNFRVLTDGSVYMQRFDANGIQVQGETVLASRIHEIHSRSSGYGAVKTLALADGGFLVGWTNFTPSPTLGIRTTFYNQRFDRQGQAVTSPFTVGEPGAIDASYTLKSDAHGGYVLSTFNIDPNNYPKDLVAMTHYGADQAGKLIVDPRPGPALLLPLSGGGYVFYATDGSGPFRQMLDSQGNPVGAATPVSTMPSSASELVDGSYVVFWETAGQTTAQHFDNEGAAIGGVLAVAANGAGIGTAALADGGFVAAWSAAGAADQDVYAQRFVESRDNRRKACLERARGMRGQERKAFMDACLA